MRRRINSGSSPLRTEPYSDYIFTIIIIVVVVVVVVIIIIVLVIMFLLLLCRDSNCPELG